MASDFNKALDKLVYMSDAIWEDDWNALKIAIYRYDGGEPKAQVVKWDKKKEETRPPGRWSSEHIEKIIPALVAINIKLKNIDLVPNVDSSTAPKAGGKDDIGF